MTDTGEDQEDGVGGSRSVTTIERATDVLFLFANAESSTLGITEIAQELGISKAVVHRILSSLRERDLVVTDAETRRYSLGPAVLHLAAAFKERLDVRPLAAATLQQLSAATDETATLSIRHGWNRVYVEQVTPNREVRMTVAIGRQFPLHAGASSKAFLAFMPGAERDDYLAHTSLAALTGETITDRGALVAELDRIRALGYARSAGERQAGAGAVAAPVFDADGAVAVISVCGPVERFSSAAEAHAVTLVDATHRLSQRLGGA